MSWGQPDTVYTTDQFGEYKTDPHRMVAELARQRDLMFAKTARWPCVLRIHETDLRALLFELIPGFPGEVRSLTPGGRIMDIPFLIENRIPLGRAELAQCPMFHMSPQDCHYRAKTLRPSNVPEGLRLYSRPDQPVGVSIETPV